MPRNADAQEPAGPPRGVVLVVGDEEYLVARSVADLVAAARSADPDAEIIERSGAEIVAAELAETLSPSLFGGARLLVVRSAQDVPVASQPSLLAALTDLPDDTAVVIQHGGGAKGKAVLDAARKAATRTITCARLTRPDERSEFVRAEVRRAHASIDAQALAALLDAVGSDLRELAAVSSQLAVDSGGHIDVKTVTSFHRGRAEVSGFTVADRAVVGDVPGATETLRWALSIGVAPVLVADALADGVRTIARVAASGERSPGALASALGMPPWKVNRARSQARGWSEAGLRQALGTVARANADVKGAAVDAGYALEKAIRDLAQDRAVTDRPAGARR